VEQSSCYMETIGHDGSYILKEFHITWICHIFCCRMHKTKRLEEAAMDPLHLQFVDSGYEFISLSNLSWICAFVSR
jgi:hypothetical protein